MNKKDKFDILNTLYRDNMLRLAKILQYLESKGIEKFTHDSLDYVDTTSQEFFDYANYGLEKDFRPETIRHRMISANELYIKYLPVYLKHGGKL